MNTSTAATYVNAISEVAPCSPSTLDQLSTCTVARIEALDCEITGLERRRLLDLGFVRGAAVQAELDPPVRGARAYRIAGTVIALRNQLARHIRIKAQ